MRKIVGLTFLLLFFNFSYCQDDIQKINEKIDKIVKNHPKEACTIPIYNTFSGDIDNVNNISEARRIDLENAKGGIVNIQGDVYFSPKEITKLIYKELEDIVGQVLKKELNPVVQNFEEDIENWKNDLKEFGKLLKGNEISIDRKNKGVQVLQEFKAHIDFTDCITNDYIDEAIVELDQNGNKEYLFNIEKIKNDPNYFFIGEEIEGFRIVKKFNKYGYISQIDGYKNIPYKYTKCKPFSHGHAQVETEHKRIVISRKGEEVFSFNKGKVDSIQILNPNRFIIHRYGNGYNNESYMVDNKRRKISNNYISISPIDKSNLFFTAVSLVDYKEEDKYDYLYIKGMRRGSHIYKYGALKSIIGIDGKNINESFKCDRTIKDYLKNRGKCRDINFIKVLVIPNTKKALYIFDLPNESDKAHLVLRDMQTQRTILYATSKSSNYYTVKHFIPSDPTTNNPYKDDIVIGYKEFYIKNKEKAVFLQEDLTFKLYDDFDKSKIILITNEPQLNRKKSNASSVINQNILSKLKVKNRRFFSLFQNRAIGDYCNFLVKAITSEKLLLYGNHMFYVSDRNIATKTIGLGIMDYEGLQIIPPVFETIKYNDLNKTFKVINHQNDTFIVDNEGNCLQNCKMYNHITRNYFIFLERLNRLEKSKQKPGYGVIED